MDDVKYMQGYAVPTIPFTTQVVSAINLHKVSLLHKLYPSLT